MFLSEEWGGEEEWGTTTLKSGRSCGGCLGALRCLFLVIQETPASKSQVLDMLGYLILLLAGCLCTEAAYYSNVSRDPHRRGLYSATNSSKPIRLNGPDPYIGESLPPQLHTPGEHRLKLSVWDAESSYYYFLTTTASSLEITAAKTLDGLRANPDRRCATFTRIQIQSS